MRSDSGIEATVHDGAAASHVLDRAKTDVVVHALLAVITLFQIAVHRRMEWQLPDSSTYIGLAESLATKGTYEFNFETNTLMPPGYPVTLALAFLIFGGGYAVYVSLTALLGGLALVAAYILLKHVDCRSRAATIVLLLASSPYYFRMATASVLSELPYMFASMVALLAATRVAVAANARSRAAFLSLLVVSLGYAVLLRSAGIALLAGLAAWIVFSFFESRETGVERLRLFLPAFLGGVAVEAAWVSWSSAAMNSARDPSFHSAYTTAFWIKDPHQPQLGLASLSDLALRPVGNLLSQAGHTATLITRWRIEPHWYPPLILACIVLILWGWSNRFCQRRTAFMDWYFAAYVGLYLVWPYDQGPRFVLPLFPLACIYLCWGGDRLLAWWQSNREASINILLAASLVVLSLGLATRLWVEQSARKQPLVSLVAWAAVLTTCVLWRLGLFGRFGMAKAPVSPTGFAFGPRGTIQILAVLLVGIGAVMQAYAARDNLHPTASQNTYDLVQAAAWIRETTAPDTVMMARNEAILHRFTARKIVPFPFGANANELLVALRRYRVQYLVVMDLPPSESFYRPSDAELFQRLVQHAP